MFALQVKIYKLIRGLAILFCIIGLIVSFVGVYADYTKGKSLLVSAKLVSDTYSNINFEGSNYFIYPFYNQDGSIKHLDVTAYDYDNGKCSISFFNDVAVDVSVNDLEMTEQEYDYLTSSKLLSPLQFLDYLIHHRKLYSNSLSLRFWYLLIICCIPVAVVVMLNYIVECIIKLNRHKLNSIVIMLFSLAYIPLIILTILGMLEIYYWCWL